VRFVLRSDDERREPHSRPASPQAVGALDRITGLAHRVGGDLVHVAWGAVTELGAIGPASRRGRRFGAFGPHSVICFPPASIFNERYMRIGANTMIGPYVTLSVGMVPGQVMPIDPVLSIGDRCLIGRGSGIVAHFSIDIADDVWTGQYVYVTDQNHDYRDIDRPISQQSQPERAVVIGPGSWLGHGTIVLPGARIGRHVAVAAGSIVNSELPDYCVAAGSPARAIRRWDGRDWPRTSDIEG